MKTRALLLLPLLALACRDNSASLQIQQICFPTDDCSFSGACDAEYIGDVNLDLGVMVPNDERLTLLLQVENQTEDNSNETTGKLNTNDAHIDEVAIEYDGPAIPRQIRGANFWVGANSTSVISVLAVPPLYGTALSAYLGALTTREMTARIRLRGYWEDGSRFETAEFPVAVHVCNGCGTDCGAGSGTCPPDSNGQDPVVCTTST